MPRPQRWLVIDIVSPSAELNGLLAEGLIASGGTAVEEQGDRLRTWLNVDDDPDAVIDRLRHRLEEVVGGSIPIEWAWHDDEDWLARWREGLTARRVGRSIIITPTWIEAEGSQDDIVIVIDPQMAFGTGEHASTRGVLRLLEDAVPPGSHVLDVGTGSAVLAMVAARRGAARVDAIESDPDALINAAENVERNGLAGRVRLEQASVDAEWLLAVPDEYDVIVANVLSRVLLPLLKPFRVALHGGGSLLLGGILQSEAEEMVEAARAAGYLLVAEDREDEWWSGRFIAPSRT
jgi:ribosomal protein L11 methyltransferase